MVRVLPGGRLRWAGMKPLHHAPGDAGGEKQQKKGEGAALSQQLYHVGEDNPGSIAR